MTSDLAAVPASYWFCVIVSERLYSSTVRRQQVFERIRLAQSDIGERERRLRRERRVGEIGRARLRAGRLSLDLAPHLPPHVEGPGARRLAGQVRDGPLAAGGGRRMRGRAVGVDGRKEPGARLADQRKRLAKLASSALTVWFDTATARSSRSSSGSRNTAHHSPFGSLVPRRGDLPALDLLVLAAKRSQPAARSRGRPARSRRAPRRPGSARRSRRTIARPASVPHSPLPAPRAGRRCGAGPCHGLCPPEVVLAAFCVARADAVRRVRGRSIAHSHGEKPSQRIGLLSFGEGPGLRMENHPHRVDQPFLPVVAGHDREPLDLPLTGPDEARMALEGGEAVPALESRTRRS